MSNQILTRVEITRESLRILHNNIVFAKGVNRQYSKEFAQTGAKIGQSINVRKPSRFTIRRGAALQVQGLNEQYVPVTLTTQYGCDTEFSSQDLTLSLDDFGKRVLSPKMAQITGAMDYDGLGLVSQIYNQVGTPGQNPGTANGANMANANSPQIFLNAGVWLDSMACPRDENRRVILNPVGQAGSVAGLSGLLNDQDTIGEQYRKGVMGRALGFEFAMDQNVNLQTTGSRANGTIVGANQTGSTANITAAGNAATIYPGEVFTANGVYALNPENRQQMSPLGALQNFVVLPPSNGAAYYTCDANGNATLNISPPITPANIGGVVQQYATVTASPANGAALVWMGAANGTTYVNNVAYHQDAFTLATADLIMPGGVDFAAREVYDGISMRIIRAYDVNSDLLPDRIDVLAGWACLRPELACRVWG